MRPSRKRIIAISVARGSGGCVFIDVIDSNDIIQIAGDARGRCWRGRGARVSTGVAQEYCRINSGGGGGLNSPSRWSPAAAAGPVDSGQTNRVPDRTIYSSLVRIRRRKLVQEARAVDGGRDWNHLPRPRRPRWIDWINFRTFELFHDERWRSPLACLSYENLLERINCKFNLSFINQLIDLIRSHWRGVYYRGCD